MIKISELTTGQGNVEIEVEIISINEPREFEKFGKKLRVADARVKDDSGEIKMSFWNEDINKVSVGKKIRITNGYVSEFKGEKQLTTGKAGKFELLE